MFTLLIIVVVVVIGIIVLNFVMDRVSMRHMELEIENLRRRLRRIEKGEKENEV